MDTQNCVICQSLISGPEADPGHDLYENGPLFLNLSKILESSSSTNCDFDFNEFKSPVNVNVNGNYKRKICSSCHHQLYQLDALTGQLNDLQLKINDISTDIRNKAVQSQLFRKGNVWAPNPTLHDIDGNLEVESPFGPNEDDEIKLDFDFNFDSTIEDHGVVEKDANVDIKIESNSTSTSNLTSDFQLQLNGPQVIESNDDDLDLNPKLADFCLKMIKICLEPIQLPSTNGPYNIKDLEIANFIQKDGERIKKYKKSMKSCNQVQFKTKPNLVYPLQDSKNFKPKPKLKPKLKPTTLNPKKVFICEVCEQAFTRLGNMKYHWEIKHDPNVHIISCSYPECSKTFKRNESLLKHQNSVHLKLKISCPDCGKGFAQTGSMRRHQQKKHPTPESL